MTIYEKLIAQQRELGRVDALDLRERAPSMEDAAIIAEQNKIPVFEPDKDYSAWEVGSPVKELVGEEYKVFKLLIPHNASEHDGTPSTLSELWQMCEENEEGGTND